VSEIRTKLIPAVKLSEETGPPQASPLPVRARGPSRVVSHPAMMRCGITVQGDHLWGKLSAIDRFAEDRLDSRVTSRFALRPKSTATPPSQRPGTDISPRVLTYVQSTRHDPDRPGKPLLALLELECVAPHPSHDARMRNRQAEIGHHSTGSRGQSKTMIPTHDPFQSANTCTDTAIPLKAFTGPSHTPDTGHALSCSRATATEMCSLPTILLFVGSKPCQPASGI
jgi:hypothetical protein